MPSIPPKPARFHPEDAPPGFEKKLISFWQDRPIITPRLQLVHTNGAWGEGSVDASFRWADQPGSGHTIPQFQIDRDGRAALLLPLNRKGIANYRAADFSIAMETADLGTLADPEISAFTEVQAESVAIALAWGAWGYDIPLYYPDTWDGTGSACHTEPFGYPVWTNSNGKICPGLKKKAQVRNVILPRAREILAAWTAPEEVEMTAQEIADAVWAQVMVVPVGRDGERVTMTADRVLREVHVLAGRATRASEAPLTEAEIARIALAVNVPGVTAADIINALGQELTD